MMSVSALPLPPTLRAWRICDPTVHAALCNAPLGRHPLLEAAYAWHERQKHRTGVPRHQYVPIISTESKSVATRLARLLSPVAWAIVGEADASSRRAPEDWVHVPTESYHRVARTLNAAWRDRGNVVDPTRSGVPAAHSGALALWRMAILVGGYQQPNGALAVHARTLAGAQSLSHAARTLKLATAPGFELNPTALLIRDPARISDLLAAAAA